MQSGNMWSKPELEVAFATIFLTGSLGRSEIAVRDGAVALPVMPPLAF